MSQQGRTGGTRHERKGAFEPKDIGQDAPWVTEKRGGCLAQSAAGRRQQGTTGWPCIRGGRWTRGPQHRHAVSIIGCGSGCPSHVRYQVATVDQEEAFHEGVDPEGTTTT
eukprot:6623125-Prorocentrum_lima.AAC.1